MRKILFVTTLFLLALSAQASPADFSSPLELSTPGSSVVQFALALNASGEAAAVWQSREGPNNLLQLSFFSQQERLPAPLTLTKTSCSISEIQVAVNAEKEIVVLWREGDGVKGVLKAAVLKEGGMAPQEMILAEGQRIEGVQLALSDQRQAAAVWERKGEERSVIECATLLLGEEWEKREMVSSDSQRVRCPGVALSRGGDLLAVWEEEGRVFAARGLFKGEWETPEPLSDASVTVFSPQLAMNQAGEALVLWQKELGFKRVLQGARFTPQQGWSQAENFFGEQESAIDFQLAFNDTGMGVAVWRASSGEELQVRTAIFKGGKWSKPETVSKKGEYCVDFRVALNNSDCCAVVWRQADKESSPLKGVTLSKKGWSSPFFFTEPGKKALHPLLAFNDGGEGVVIWREKRPTGALLEAEFFVLQSELAEPPAAQDERDGAPAASAAEESRGEAPLAPETPAAQDERDNAPAASAAEESRGEASLALAEPLLQRDRKEIRQKKWLAEARGSAYRPNDRLFRKIYSDLLAAGGLLLDYTFKRHWSVATEIEFLQKTGHSIGKHDRTRMQLIPISVLLRYHCFIGTVYDLYFGLGPRYFILRTQNDLNAVRRNTTDQALGGVAEAGVLFQIGPSLTFDLFFAYSYGKITGSPKKTNIEGRSLNVGGLQAGAGIGFRF
ncbi:MAG: hypothetical protein A2Z85_03990 [Chlamydiae bacterium GWA2_50_15]|nr:MAG: hypothetical protein A2Z85_03990 [Chlamydiae bacterium GWA2_50_15]